MNNKSNAKKNLILFLYSLYLSSFTFGGGFVIVSFMKKIYIDKLHWIDEKEMLDITTIAQSSPGAIAVNASLLLGYKINGILGAFCAMLGTIIPPIIIICVVSLIYNLVITSAVVGAIMLAMQAGISAIICDVCINLSMVVAKEKNYFAIIIMPTAFCLTFFLKVNVLFLILPCIALGLGIALYKNHKLKKIQKNNVDNPAMQQSHLEEVQTDIEKHQEEENL